MGSDNKKKKVQLDKKALKKQVEAEKTARLEKLEEARYAQHIALHKQEELEKIGVDIEKYNEIAKTQGQKAAILYASNMRQQSQTLQNITLDEMNQQRARENAIILKYAKLDDELFETYQKAKENIEKNYQQKLQMIQAGLDPYQPQKENSAPTKETQTQQTQPTQENIVEAEQKPVETEPEKADAEKVSDKALEEISPKAANEDLQNENEIESNTTSQSSAENVTPAENVENETLDPQQQPDFEWNEEFLAAVNGQEKPQETQQTELEKDIEAENLQNAAAKQNKINSAAIEAEAKLDEQLLKNASMANAELNEILGLGNKPQPDLYQQVGVSQPTSSNASQDDLYKIVEQEKMKEEAEQEQTRNLQNTEIKASAEEVAKLKEEISLAEKCSQFFPRQYDEFLKQNKLENALGNMLLFYETEKAKCIEKNDHDRLEMFETGEDNRSTAERKDAMIYPRAIEFANYFKDDFEAFKQGKTFDNALEAAQAFAKFVAIDNVFDDKFSSYPETFELATALDKKEVTPQTSNAVKATVFYGNQFEEFKKQNIENPHFKDENFAIAAFNLQNTVVDINKIRQAYSIYEAAERASGVSSNQPNTLEEIAAKAKDVAQYNKKRDRVKAYQSLENSHVTFDFIDQRYNAIVARDKEIEENERQAAEQFEKERAQKEAEALQQRAAQQQAMQERLAKLQEEQEKLRQAVEQERQKQEAEQERQRQPEEKAEAENNTPEKQNFVEQKNVSSEKTPQPGTPTPPNNPIPPREENNVPSQENVVPPQGNTDFSDTKYSRTKRTQTLQENLIAFDNGQSLIGLSQNIQFKNPANGAEKHQVLSVLASSEKQPHVLLAVTREGNDKPLAVFEKDEAGKIVLRLEKNFAKSFAGVNIEKPQAGDYFSYNMEKLSFSQSKGIETAQVSSSGEIAVAISAIAAVIKDTKSAEPSRVFTQNPFNIALTKEFIEMGLSKTDNGCTLEKEEPLFSAVMVCAIQLERNIANSTQKEEIVPATFGDVKLYSVPIKSPDGKISYLNVKEEDGKVFAYVQMQNPNNKRSKTEAKFEQINSVRLAQGKDNVQSIVIEFGTGNGVSAKKTAYIDANFEDNSAFINLMNDGNILSDAAKKADSTLGASRASSAEPFAGHTVYDFDGQTSTLTTNLNNVGVLALEEVEPTHDKVDVHVEYDPSYGDGGYNYNIIPPEPAPQPEPPQNPDDNNPTNPNDGGNNHDGGKDDGINEPIVPPTNGQPSQEPENPAPEKPQPEPPQKEAPSNEKPKQEKPKTANTALWEPKPTNPKKKTLLYSIAATCMALSCVMPIPFAILTVIMGAWAVAYDLEVLNGIKNFVNNTRIKGGKENDKDFSAEQVKLLERDLEKATKQKDAKVEKFNELNSEIEFLEGATVPDAAKIEKLKKQRDALLPDIERLTHKENALKNNLQQIEKRKEENALKKESKQLEREIKKSGKETEPKAFRQKVQQLDETYHNLNKVSASKKQLQEEFFEEYRLKDVADGSGVKLKDGYIATEDTFEKPQALSEKEQEKLSAIEEINESSLSEEQLEFKKKMKKKLNKGKSLDR